MKIQSPFDKIYKYLTLSLFVSLLLSACGNNEYPWENNTNTDRSQYESDYAFQFVVDSTDINAPMWDQTLNNGAGGYKPKAEDPRDIVYLDDTFHVDEGESITYENKIIYITASDDEKHNLNIKGNLTFNNCLLLWQQNTYEQLPLEVTGRANLTLIDSYAFSNQGGWIHWNYRDNATINLDNYVGNPWTTINDSVSYHSSNYSTAYLTVGNNLHDTDVDIKQSHNVSLEMYPQKGSSVLELSKKNIWGDLSLDGVWDNVTFQVQDSYLTDTAIAISPEVDVTIENATDGVKLGWEISKETFNGATNMQSCRLDSLGSPSGVDNSIIAVNQTWDCGNSHLTLINSKITSAWPSLIDNINLTVTNSYLVDPRHNGNTTNQPTGTYTIQGSTIESAMVFSGGQMYLDNDKILTDISVTGQGSEVRGCNLVYQNENKPIPVNESDGGIITVDSCTPFDNQG